MQYLKKLIAVLVALAPFAIAALFSPIEWRFLQGKGVVLGYILFCFGGFISVVNFYWYFLRYPIFLLLGGKKDEYRWISSIPLMGILSVAGFVFIPQTLWISIAIFLLLTMDMGSISWFVVAALRDDTFWQ